MTALIGTLVGPDAEPVTGSLWLELSQTGTYSGILVTPEPPVVFSLVAGQITGPGLGPYEVYGNDGIVPDVTFYKLTAFDTSGQQVLRENVLLTGATADLGALVFAPTGSWVSPPPGWAVDGNKGDITVAGEGMSHTINPKVVTYAKIQDVSATDKLLGRATAGAGSVEEIPCGSDSRSFLAQATSALKRVALGLGTSAQLNVPAAGDAAAGEVVKGNDSRLDGGILTPEQYGGKADGRYNTAAAISAASNVLVLSGGGHSFLSTDVGKTIAVEGAAPSSGLLITTILGYSSPTQVTLAASASTAAFGAWVYWGTNNASALASIGGAATQGCRIQFRPGFYVSTAALAIGAQGLTVAGAGKEATFLVVLSTTANAIEWSVTGTGQVVQDLSVWGMGGFATAGAGIAYTGTAHPYFRSGVRNVALDRVFYGLHLPNPGPVLYELSNVTIHRAVSRAVFSHVTCMVHGAQVYANAEPYTGRFSISNGSATLTAGVATFTSHHLGDNVWVVGAGAGGAALRGKITAIASSTSCTIDTAASGTVAAANGQITARTVVGWEQVDGGGYLVNVDIIGGENSLRIWPDTGQGVFAFIGHNVLCDSPYDVGLRVSHGGTGSVRSVRFVNSWFSSAGAYFAIPSGIHRGVDISMGSAGYGQHFMFSGCEFVNSRAEGLAASYASGLTVKGSLFENGVAGLAQQALVDSTEDVVVNGNSFTREVYGAGGTTTYSLTVAGTCSGAISVQGNLLRAFSTAGYSGIADDGAGVLVRNNATLA